ncbi:tetratricopeptide repeat protein [Undibacterium parvum]|uniref:Uncharacterized protein n=1 Tax=Undibacterium parvum TaxID=401471 RepID=A0A3S9HH35_9BURK|nr:hypothetical protein [Undibacterium parvum]AZP11424.1 hypothetical protein EJN92_05080 [Undibacterium parvum]
MSISDPSQLLQRIPELLQLVDVPAIRRAIETGDAFKVYRVLILARLFRRLPEHRELLQMLTSERRLFAKAYKNKPYFGGLKYFGFGFLGAAESDSDDSHIALHALTLGALIPLIPLGCYVVKSSGERQWHIYAKAPLGVGIWLYTRALALSLVTLIIFGAVHNYHQYSTQDVMVINGFDVALDIKLNGNKIKLPAQGRVNINVKHGLVTGSAEIDKIGVIDNFKQTVHSGTHYNIWNIAGAAPLLLNTSNYSSDQTTPTKPPAQQTVYCGSRYIELPNIDYAFVELPAISSFNKLKEGQAVRQLMIEKSDELPTPAGVTLCVEYAFRHSQEKSMAAALEVLAKLHDWDAKHAQAAISAAQQVSNAEAIRIATLALQAQPDNVDYERRYQDVMIEAGQYQQLLSQYAAKAQQHPESATAQYLHASLLAGLPGLAAMQAAHLSFPQDASILSALAWRKAIHADYSGAYQDILKLRQLSPKHADTLFDTEVRTLLAQGRKLDALNLLNAAARDKRASARAARAADFALVARQANADPEFWFKQLPPSVDNASSIDFYRIRAGLAPKQAAKNQDNYVQLALALRNNPSLAVQLARALDPYQLSSLASDQMLLLFGEALKIEDASLIKRLQNALHLSKEESGLLSNFMQGEAVDLDQFDLALEMQPAAYLIRSRNPQLSDAERAGLRSLAARTDFMRGPVTTALTQWPARN